MQLNAVNNPTNTKNLAVVGRVCPFTVYGPMIMHFHDSYTNHSKRLRHTSLFNH